MRGVPAREVMAELFGRATGMSGGMGGLMHMFDRDRRFMGGYGIVGENLSDSHRHWVRRGSTQPARHGDLLLWRWRGQPGHIPRIAQYGGLWHLPVLFVCENNHYAIGTDIHRHSAVAEVYRRAAAYKSRQRRSTGWTC